MGHSFHQPLMKLLNELDGKRLDAMFCDLTKTVLKCHDVVEGNENIGWEAFVVPCCFECEEVVDVRTGSLNLATSDSFSAVKGPRDQVSVWKSGNGSLKEPQRLMRPPYFL